MTRIKANLFDENWNLVGSLEVQNDEDYHVNGYFQTADGGFYLIAEIRPGEPPIDQELDAMWLDGPAPTSLVGRHS